MHHHHLLSQEHINTEVKWEESEQDAKCDALEMHNVVVICLRALVLAPCL